MLTQAEADDLLPQAPSSEQPNPLRLNYLFIGPPKFGKTTFFCSIANALLVAFEQGHAFQVAHKMVVDCWDKKVTEDNPAIWVEEGTGIYHTTMAKLVEVLEATDKFPFIIIDTADMAAKMCLDYYLRKFGWNHAQDGGDYGKGHDIAQNTPFRHMVGRLLRTGRGIGFITHSQVNKNELTAKKETTLPGGVYKFLHTQADVILHGRFGSKQKGKRYHDRIVRTEGDENTLAGNRVKGLSIPAEYIMDPDHPWEQWTQFFTDATAVTTAEEDLRMAALNTEEAAAPDTQEAPEGEQPAEAKPKAAPKKGRK